MRQILAHRAQLVFKPNVLSEETLDLVANLTYQREDLRHGLDILYRAGCEADQERLEKIMPGTASCGITILVEEELKKYLCRKFSSIISNQHE